MDTKQIHVRETNDSDLNDILEVEKQAFGYDKEAELVRQLLSDETAAPVVSLLAMHENEAVGHQERQERHPSVLAGGDLAPLLAAAGL